jgi:hypothetical protein
MSPQQSDYIKVKMIVSIVFYTLFAGLVKIAYGDFYPLYYYIFLIALPVFVEYLFALKYIKDFHE